MRFSINQNDERLDSTLTYVVADYSFNTSPVIKMIDFEIEINRLVLTVVDQKVKQVWGLCPHTSWIHVSLVKPPVATVGDLVVNDEPSNGYVFDLTSGNDWPVFVDTKTGWVIIGDTKKQGMAVEFMRGCIAVTVNDELISLWLKPERLPQFA